MPKYAFRLSLVALAALPAVAIAADAQPWSEIRLENVADARRDEHALMMIAIDGSRDVPSRSTYRLPPGTQSLRLASTKRDSAGSITSQPYAIETQPCVRYVLVADHAQTPSNARWRIVVKAREPIEACVERYGIVAQVATTQVADAPR